MALKSPLPVDVKKPRAPKARAKVKTRKPRAPKAPLKKELLKMAKAVKKEKCPPISKMKKVDLVKYIQKIK
jgi:hypothetical protein